MRSWSSCSASRSRASVSASSTPRLGVGRLEQLELALGRQVAPRAEAVGQGRRVGGRAQELGQPPAAAALAEHGEHAAQLATELVDPCRRRGIDHLVGLDPQTAAGAGHAGAERGTVQAAQDRGVDAVGQLARLLDVGDGPDARVAAVDAGHEQYPAVGGVGRGDRGLGLVGVEREGHDGLGQDDPGRQRQDGEGQGVEFGHVGELHSRCECRRLNSRSPGPIPDCECQIS